MTICYFNGVGLHDNSIDEVMALIFSGSLGERSYVVTPNADHFDRLDSGVNPLFNKAYSEASLRVCDSRVIRMMSFLEGKRIRHVCPGSDLTNATFASDHVKTLALLVVGSSPELVSKLRIRFGIDNIVCYSPPMGFLKNKVEFDKCVDLVLASSVDIVFLAVGSPQQEILACEIRAKGNLDSRFKGVMLCVGASLDFLTGEIQRAPIFFQKMHIEWFYRILKQPRRLIPRYAANFQWLVKYCYKRLIR